MAIEANIPTLSVVVITALIDSINPCAIGVLILLVSILVASKKKARMLQVGFAYIMAIMITYIAAGFGLLYFLTVIPLWVSEFLSIIIGAILVFGGIIEIKDYFWYGQGISLHIPARRAKQIHAMMKHISIPGVMLLGAFVAAVELPCTGGPYMAILLLLSQNFDTFAVILLLIYNVIFVSPLIVILMMVWGGAKVQNIKRWKMANREYMRLAIGIILIVLGWLLMLIANGTINLN